MSTSAPAAPAKAPRKSARDLGREAGQAETVRAIEESALTLFFTMDLERVCANPILSQSVEHVYLGYAHAWTAAGGGQ